MGATTTIMMRNKRSEHQGGNTATAITKHAHTHTPKQLQQKGGGGGRLHEPGPRCNAEWCRPCRRPWSQPVGRGFRAEFQTSRRGTSHGCSSWKLPERASECASVAPSWQPARGKKGGGGGSKVSGQGVSRPSRPNHTSVRYCTQHHPIYPPHHQERTCSQARMSVDSSPATDPRRSRKVRLKMKASRRSSRCGISIISIRKASACGRTNGKGGENLDDKRV